MKFKEGDLVRRVNSNNCSAMTVGTLWEVDSYEKDHDTDKMWLRVKDYDKQLSEDNVVLCTKLERALK